MSVYVNFENDGELEQVGPFYAVYTNKGRLLASRNDNSPGQGPVVVLAEVVSGQYVYNDKTYRDFAVVPEKS